jgi:YD repeat-containing protein
MHLKLAVALLATLQPFAFMSGESLRATPDQSDPAITNKLSGGENSSMSDREKAGLRGPVELYTEEHTFPAVDNVPARTYTTATKFSPKGRILQSTNSNASEAGPQEFSTTYTYDSAGRLLKKTSAGPGSPTTEIKYSYDEKGQIISITGDPLGASSFEYDNNGRKTRIMSAPSKPLVPEGTQYMFPMPEGEDPYLPVPAGGHAKILFNERGQPVEWQVSDANGNLVNKLIRNYDENGRLAELRYTIESFQYLLPAEAQQELMADPGAAEEMAAQLTNLLGEQRNLTTITYSYDADGRLIEQHHYTGYSMEGTTKITYNDHSDKLEERQFTTGDPNPPSSPQPTEVSSRTSPYSRESHVQYSYKYDNFGNWTEQTTGSPTSANNDGTVIRRTLIYFSPQSLEAAATVSEQRGGQPFARRFWQRVGAFLAPR